MTEFEHHRLLSWLPCVCKAVESQVYCPQEPARALLQRRASSIASPTAGIQGFLKSPRQSLDGAERDRRGSSIPGHQRGAVMQQSSPTMTDATGLVSTLLP